jgi:MFS family permease
VVRARETFSAVVVAARNENVRRAELAWGAAITAEWAHFVALGVFAYKGGGASAVGIAGLVRLLPAAIVAPVAASLGDRFRRERFLLAVTLLGAVAFAASAAASFAHERLLVYLFAAVVGLSSTLIRPTLQALLPSLARTPQELIASNGATSTIESVGTLVGPLLAGVLLSTTTVGVVFAVGAGLMLLAAAQLTRVHEEGRVPAASEAAPTALLHELGAGFEAIARVPAARLVAGLMVAQTFVRGCLNVLIVVAAFRLLHAGASGVGYMTAAIGVGGLLGALGSMTLSRGRLGGSFALSLVFWGVPIALIAPRPYLAVALVLLAVVGAANSVEDVAGFTLLQRTVADDALTRVLGLFWGAAMGAVALGSLAAPALVGALGPRTAFLLVGAILPLVTLAAYRSLMRLDRARESDAELEVIDQVPMFAPLSISAKERLAAKLIPVSVGAGEQVVRAGDIGDRFYIVRDGEFDVEIDDLHKTAGGTDYFGEIALLRDVPRTATVTARVDSRLYALQRGDFLATVTGHSAAHTAGQAVVDARMSRDVDIVRSGETHTP